MSFLCISISPASIVGGEESIDQIGDDGKVSAFSVVADGRTCLSADGWLKETLATVGGKGGGRGGLAQGSATGVRKLSIILDAAKRYVSAVV